MSLKELRRARAKLAAEIKARKKQLATKLEDLPDGEDLPADDVDGLATLQAQLDAQDARIARLETLVEEDGDDVEPISVDPDDADAGKSAHAQRVRTINRSSGLLHSGEEPPRSTSNPANKGLQVARFMLGLAWAKEAMSFGAAAQRVERQFGDKAVAKALNTSGTATGGALVPQNFIPDLIELLRAMVVVRSLQPMIIDMPGGNATVPRLAAGATAAYQGELDDMSVSQQTFDDLQLNAKKLTAMVPVSNDLIRRSAINVDGIVRDDLVQTLARREDLAFMLADGSLGQPIGFLNLVAATNMLRVPAFAAADNGTILTAVVGVLQGMMLMLKLGMSRMVRPAWIMSPAVEMFLMGLRDQVGNFIYEAEMLEGKLLRIPYKTSQQIPTNINTGSSGSPVNNGSYLILADFADVVLAETLNYRIDIADQASYAASGATVSAFQRDQTVFRVIEEHDFNMRHQASLAVALLPGWVPAGYTNFGPGMSYYVQAPSGDSSAAPSTFGTAAPTGSNNPANIAATVAGGTLPGRP